MADIMIPKNYADESSISPETDDECLPPHFADTFAGTSHQSHRQVDFTPRVGGTWATEDKGSRVLGQAYQQISVQAAPALWEPRLVPEQGDSLPASRETARLPSW